MKSKLFAISFIGLAILPNIGCSILVLVTYTTEAPKMELITLLVLLTITAPILFAATVRRDCLIVLALRVLCFYIICRLIHDDYPYVVVLLSLPLLTEIALFLQPKLSLPISIAVLVLAAHYLLLGLGLYQRSIIVAGADTLVQVCSALLCMTGISMSMILMIHYREKAVETVNSQESLRMIVGNIMESNMKLQYFAANEGSKAAQKERLRITREVHDVVGYALSNITMVLNAARISDSTDMREQLIESAKNMTDECLQETRRILHKIRIPVFETTDALGMIHRLVDTFERATGIAVELHFTNSPQNFGDEIKSAFYRFVQVGLVNSFTHGKASKVRIIMGVDGRSLYASMWDNGSGINQNFKKGIGLTGMTERMASLGGFLNVKNCVDGFEIRASVPLGGHTSTPLE